MNLNLFSAVNYGISHPMCISNEPGPWTFEPVIGPGHGFVVLESKSLQNQMILGFFPPGSEGDKSNQFIDTLEDHDIYSFGSSGSISGLGSFSSGTGSMGWSSGTNGLWSSFSLSPSLSNAAQTLFSFSFQTQEDFVNTIQATVLGTSMATSYVPMRISNRMDEVIAIAGNNLNAKGLVLDDSKNLITCQKDKNCWSNKVFVPHENALRSIKFMLDIIENSQQMDEDREVTCVKGFKSGLFNMFVKGSGQYQLTQNNCLHFMANIMDCATDSDWRTPLLNNNIGTQGIAQAFFKLTGM